ncbi:MAG: hypothetical protein ACK4Q5_17350 [Saprospiraceae bacterium]
MSKTRRGALRRILFFKTVGLVSKSLGQKPGTAANPAVFLFSGRLGSSGANNFWRDSFFRCFEHGNRGRKQEIRAYSKFKKGFSKKSLPDISWGHTFGEILRTRI